MAPVVSITMVDISGNTQGAARYEINWESQGDITWSGFLEVMTVMIFVRTMMLNTKKKMNMDTEGYTKGIVSRRGYH